MSHLTIIFTFYMPYYLLNYFNRYHQFQHALKQYCTVIIFSLVALFALVTLQGCSTTQEESSIKEGIQQPVKEIAPPDIALKLPPDFEQPAAHVKTINMPNSRWVPAAWSELPGWSDDEVGQAWEAWIQSCKEFSPIWVNECAQIIHLASASENRKRQWMYDSLQPYRIESLEGKTSGMLTAYYEPIFRASRLPIGDFKYPLYYRPDDLHATKPYWDRQAIDSNPKVTQALSKHIFAYLADPIDALILHIQGSGQLIITEPDGSAKTVRAAFAATNNHRYGSVGRYLLDRKLITDGTWPGIKAWLSQNPHRLNEVLWSNPRYVFFREEEIDIPSQGPIGAQGVPLTYGRSIAVDKRSVPYGTPVWISSSDVGNITPPIQRLVLAQDTGSAIIGAVRADYFWGKGPYAGEQAGRTKQTLYMWAFLPRTPTPKSLGE